MPRIPEITERESLPEEKRPIFDQIGSSRGTVRLPFSLLLNSPETAGRTAHLGTYLRFESALMPVDREVAILVAAREADCGFEWAAHVRLGREAGVRDEVIDVIGNRKGVEALEATEALIITYGRELLRDKRVSQATFDRVRDRFGDQAIVDLTGTLSYYTMLACHINAYGVEPPADGAKLP